MGQKKEAEELERIQELYIKEQTEREQKKQEGKRNIMKAYQVNRSQTGGQQAQKAQKLHLYSIHEICFD